MLAVVPISLFCPQVQAEENVARSKKEAANRRKQKRKLKKHEKKAETNPAGDYDGDMSGEEEAASSVPAEVPTASASTTTSSSSGVSGKKAASQADSATSSSNNNNNNSSSSNTKSGGNKKTNAGSANIPDNNNPTRSYGTQEAERDSGTDSHSHTSLESKSSAKYTASNNNNNNVIINTSQNQSATDVVANAGNSKAKKNKKKKEAALAEEASEVSSTGSSSNVPAVAVPESKEVATAKPVKTNGSNNNAVNKAKTNMNNNNSGKAAKSDGSKEPKQTRQQSPEASLASLNISNNNNANNVASNATTSDNSTKIKRENTKAQMNKSTTSSKKKQQKQQQQQQQAYDSGVPASTTAISELDTFSDVSPDLLDRLSSMAFSPPKTSTNTPSSSAARLPVNGCYPQDSVASLDTFGEPLPSGIPDLMSTAVLVPQPSPKKLMVMRGLNQPSQEGWKEVNRKGKKVTADNAAISRIIGRGGCNINAIREYSNAHIEVEKQGKTTSSRSIMIKGSAEATNKAFYIINALVKDSEMELSDLIPKSVAPVVSTTKLSAMKTTSAASVSGPSVTSAASAGASAARLNAVGAIKVTKVSAILLNESRVFAMVPFFFIMFR